MVSGAGTEAIVDIPKTRESGADGKKEYEITSTSSHQFQHRLRLAEKYTSIGKRSQVNISSEHLFREKKFLATFGHRFTDALGMTMLILLL